MEINEPNDIQILESINPNQTNPIEEDDEMEVQMILRNLIRQRAETLKLQRKPNYVPPFYINKKHSEDDVATLFREMSYQRFLRERYAQLDCSHVFIEKIIAVRNSRTEKDQDFVTYDEFNELFKEDKVEPIKSLFLTASAFIHFPRISDGKVSLEFFHYYVTEKCRLIEFQTILMYYAREEIGYVSEVELEQFITDHVLKYFDALHDLPERMHIFYIHHTVRKFLFFLDSNHTGKISLKTFWNHPLLKELLAINEADNDQNLIGNWFTPQKALSIYQAYLELDLDRDGMLSQDELMKYGALTKGFTKRVFECTHVFDGKMDYKSFLDFAIAMENKDTKEGLGYFFRLLDINNVGYLTSFNINYFFKDINEFLRSHEYDPVPVEDIRDEIFDMIHPSDPLKITFNDLYTSKAGKLFINMLIDGSEFWKYDNRESLMQQDEEIQ